MKKQFIMVCAVAGMFGACTNSNDPAIEQGDGEQVIRLKVSSIGDGMSTRAGRDLFSEEADQAVDNVKIVVVDNDNKVVAQTTVGNWSQIAEKSDGGFEAIAKIPSANRVANPGTYRIYAYGYSNGTEYTDLATTLGQIESNDDFNETQILAFSEASAKVGEELFAGAGTLTVVESNNSATGDVILTRQVAGTFGYFKNIPYINGASKLVLKTYANLNTKLVLGGFDKENVVNGTEESESSIIYTINLGDWFSEMASTAENAIADTSWTNPYESSGATFAKGSVFGGSFIIPFEAVTEKNTFVLELQDDNDAVLRNWTVKLPTTDTQVGTYKRWNWDGNSFVESDVTEDLSSYSILRNHLYSVGTRTVKNPANPGEDPNDAPVDLNRDQILTLTVSANWEAIHHMDIE